MEWLFVRVAYVDGAPRLHRLELRKHHNMPVAQCQQWPIEAGRKEKSGSAAAWARERRPVQVPRQFLEQQQGDGLSPVVLSSLATYRALPVPAGCRAGVTARD